LPIQRRGMCLLRQSTGFLNLRKSAGESLPALLFLQNHGVFVAADSPEAIDSMYESIFATLKNKVRPLPVEAENRSAEWNSLQNSVQHAVEKAASKFNVKFKFTSNSLLRHFLASQASFASLEQPFTPDHIVYAGAWPLFLHQEIAVHPDSLCTALHAYSDAHHELPKILAIEKLGIFGLGRDAPAADRACQLFYDAAKIAWYAQSFGGVHPMEPADIAFIRNWEVEKFRASVALHDSSS